MLSTDKQTNKQTDRQTNQRYQKHNLLCQGGNNVKFHYSHWQQKFILEWTLTLTFDPRSQIKNLHTILI